MRQLREDIQARLAEFEDKSKTAWTQEDHEWLLSLDLEGQQNAFWAVCRSKNVPLLRSFHCNAWKDIFERFQRAMDHGMDWDTLSDFDSEGNPKTP